MICSSQKTSNHEAPGRADLQVRRTLPPTLPLGILGELGELWNEHNTNDRKNSGDGSKVGGNYPICLW